MRISTKLEEQNYLLVSDLFYDKETETPTVGQRGRVYESGFDSGTVVSIHVPFQFQFDECNNGINLV